MAYSVTKHAAVAVAEWLAITYGDAGDQGLVPMPAGRPHADARRWRSTDPIGAAPLLAEGLLEPEEVAEAVVAGDPRRAVPDPAPRGGRAAPGAEGLASPSGG